MASQETPPSLLPPPRSTLPWSPPSMPRPPIGIALSGVASVNVVPGIMVPVGITGVAPGTDVVPGTVVGVAPDTVVVVVIVPGNAAVGVAPGMVVDFWLRSRDGYKQQQRKISSHVR